MGLYHAVHLDPKGAGDTRPTALQIIRDEAREGKFKGKIMVITGATSGIGLETARPLSVTGASLFLLGRDPKTAQSVLGQILEPGRTTVTEMDVASLSSVRAAAAISCPTPAIKSIFGSATPMLKPAVLSSASPNFHSRVVSVSSSSHRACGLCNGDDYVFWKEGNTYSLAYCNSKLAQIYMSNEIDCDMGTHALHATSLHPGAINTDLARNIGNEFVKQLFSNEHILKILKSPEQGAATTVMTAKGKDWENKGGKYLEDFEEGPRGEDDGQESGTDYVSKTYHGKEESRLWRNNQITGHEWYSVAMEKIVGSCRWNSRVLSSL